MKILPSVVSSSSKMAFVKVILALIIACSEILHVTADVLAISPQNLTSRFQSLPAAFGPPIPSSGIEGLLVVADPIDACGAIAKAPQIPNNRTYPMLYFALIKRGNCDFDKKVLNAQQANYNGAIVYNNEGNVLTTMSGKTVADSVVISSVFVGLDSGLQLQGMNYTTGYETKLLLNYTSWAYYFTSFFVVTCICVLVCVMFSVAKYVRDQRRRRKARLSRDHLKKLPTKKFKKGDEYDVCAICLDDYEEGQKLRILPCNHAFHCKCIDPWLTNNRRTCPICKRKVVPPGMVDSDADSDSEDGDAPNENTPLLAGMETDAMSERGAVGGTSGISTPPPSPTPSSDDPHDPPVVALINVDSDSDSDSAGSFPMEEAVQDIQTLASETVRVTVHSENETEPSTSSAVKA